MSKQAALALAAIGAGFLVGFLVGSGTRDAMPSVTDASVEGSTLHVRVRLGDALRAGISSLLP